MGHMVAVLLARSLTAQQANLERRLHLLWARRRAYLRRSKDEVEPKVETLRSFALPRREIAPHRQLSVGSRADRIPGVAAKSVDRQRQAALPVHEMSPAFDP